MSNIFITRYAPFQTSRSTLALSALAGFFAALPVAQAQTLPPGVAQTTTKTPTAARRVLISELRTGGPGGASDSFVELANVSSQPIELGGWSLRIEAAGGAFSVQIPAGVSLPAHGHFLLAGRQYSLAKTVAADLEIERAFSGGVQLRDAKNQLVDAVGPRRADAAFREGDGLDDIAFAEKATAAGSAQFSCVRRFETSGLRDSNDNARDFVVVSVNGKVGASVARLGAPGPENLSSPPLNFDNTPLLAKTNTKNGEKANPEKTNLNGETVAPPVNVFHRPTLRDREATGAGKGVGTMTLRCRLVNITDRPITRLNFRIDGISNVPTAALVDQNSALIADVRMLPRPKNEEKDAGATNAGATNLNTSLKNEPKLWEASLDEPPAQPLGGGFNSSVSVQLPKDGLAPGAAGDVDFVLGVERSGRYRVVLDSEHFHLTFEGDTEQSEKSTLFNGQKLATSALGGTTSVGVGNLNTPNGAPNNGGATVATHPNTANPTSEQPAAEKPDLSSVVIVFQGNTEDEFDTAEVVTSPLNISSFRVKDGTIALLFGGALDAQSAGDITRYFVLVNEEVVEAERATYDARTNTVSLVLPEGTLRRGDTVFIKWTELKDAQNRVLNGQVGPTKVP